eukprot:PhF_6_TR2584/c0_g1_i1/m.4370
MRTYFFALILLLSVLQVPAQYLCSRSLTEMSSNGWGESDLLEWTYITANKTLNIRYTAYVRFGWAAIGFQPATSVGMNNIDVVMGYFSATPSNPTAGCVATYKTSNSQSLLDHPTPPTIVSWTFERNGNEGATTTFRIDTTTLSNFDPSKSRVAVSSNYMSSTPGYACPQSASKITQHSSKDGKDPRANLGVFNWLSAGGKDCTSNAAPSTSAPSAGPSGAPTTAPSNGPSSAPTSAPTTAPTTAPVPPTPATPAPTSSALTSLVSSAVVGMLMALFL